MHANQYTATEPKGKNLNVRIPAGIRAQMEKAIKASPGLTMADIIREALERHFEIQNIMRGVTDDQPGTDSSTDR